MTFSKDRQIGHIFRPSHTMQIELSKQEGEEEEPEWISKKSRLLKFCFVLVLALALQRLFLRWPITVHIKETRPAVHAIDQSIF
jgi:hypothetical protein